MTKHQHTLPLLFACGLILSPVLIFAQTATESAAKEDGKEDILHLSPFVVDGANDEGYNSSVSTSGSRLKTDLKDIAASVTVLTNDFLDDLGATDIATALAFVAGAENDSTTDPTSIGLNQGYLGGDFGDVNSRSDEVRVRGLGRGSITSNYIPVIASTDRYNTERAEFLRGANSILFGLSEPAGLINNSTKIANLRKSINKVETKVDNFGSSRVVLDVSRALIKDKLAVRAVGLHSDRRYDVNSAFLRDKRLFLTTTYKPFANTTVRAYLEHTQVNGRRPNFRTPQDNVSGWLELYNQYAPSLTPAQIASAFYWDPTVLTSTGTPLNSIVTVAGQTIDLGLLRRANDGNANATALIYGGNDWDNPLDNTATIFATRNATGGAVNGATRSMFVRSSSPLENRPNPYADPQVTNPSVFPFTDVEISALPGNYRWEKGRKWNFTVDQRITDDLYLSASYQHEDFLAEQAFSPIAQQSSVQIDINTKLPDGRVNPNFLRPFIYGRSLGEHRDQGADNLLVQANFDFDFAKKTQSKWLRALGAHRLTALYTASRANRLYYRWNNQIDNNITGIFTPGLTNAARHLYQFWYIGDPVQVGDTGLRLTEFPTTTIADTDGRNYDYTYYDTVSKTWKKSPEQIHISRQLVGGGRAYTGQTNDGVGVSLQSYFWNRRIVTLFGLRKDNVDAYTNTLISTAEPLTGATRADYTTGDPQFSNSKKTATKSIVFHVTNWLRIFGSTSENFAASNPRTDPLFRPIAPQNGLTKEIGLGFDLFDSKLQVRTSAFRSSQNNASSSGASSTASLRVEVIEDQIYSALSATGRLGEWSTIGPNGPTTDEYSRPLDIAATEDSISEGIELNVIYNPTRNWRISFNAAKLNNVTTHVGRELTDFLDYRADFYKKYFQEGLRTDGSNNTNPTTSSLISNNFANAVASNYVGNILKEGTSNPGIAEYTYKVVTSYSFRDGRLKGISVGGNAYWESGKVFGYDLLNTTFNVGGLENYPGTVADPNKPFFRSAVIQGGLFVNYKRKIFDGKVMWKVQLNAQNLFGEHGLRQTGVNPDQSAVWGVAPSRTYELTNTFEF